METVVHCEESAPVSAVARLLLAKRWTLGVAESCSGGGIGYALTGQPGSSQWFTGGVVCYEDDVKRRILGVPDELLRSYGAVSEQVAVAMARGVRELLRTDLSVAVTGVAGPGGGSAQKPVGTVWIAWSSEQENAVRHFHFAGDREQIRARTIISALQGFLTLFA